MCKIYICGKNIILHSLCVGQKILRSHHLFDRHLFIRTKPGLLFEITSKASGGCNASFCSGNLVVFGLVPRSWSSWLLGTSRLGTRSNKRVRTQEWGTEHIIGFNRNPNISNITHILLVLYSDVVN